MAAAALAGTVLVAAAAVCLGSGCTTLGYYAQAARGHLDLLARARPVADWLADPATGELLRQRLELSQRLRDFATRELKLPDNASYRRYADLGRDAAVYNVVAAPELALTLKTWCYPVLGCVGYRGYFARADAEAPAAELRARGYETLVYGVGAYSTLRVGNWFGGDPLLNTFTGGSEGALARLLFHELAHQVAYADDDTEFNESFATAVERIGWRRWQAQRGGAGAQADAAAQQADDDRRRQAFRELTARWRARLQALYASGLPEADKRREKAALMQGLRDDYARTKAGQWGGYAGYDGWFAGANNASFAVLAAYTELVPAFEALFDQSGGDFERFYGRVRELAALPRDRRRAALPVPAASAAAGPTSPQNTTRSE